MHAFCQKMGKKLERVELEGEVPMFLCSNPLLRTKYSNNQISKYSDSYSSQKIGIIHYSNNIGPSPQRRERVEELRALLALDIGPS